MPRRRSSDIHGDRGAGTLEYLGVVVVAVVLVAAVIAGVRSSGVQQRMANALCDLQSAVTQAGDCGGADEPTTYGGDRTAGGRGDGEGLTSADPAQGDDTSDDGDDGGESSDPEYANASDDRGVADPDRVADSLRDIRDALGGGFLGVREGDLEDAREAVADLNGPELDALIASMDGEELEHWVNQMDDGWMQGGWSREERRDLWELLATRASKETLDRLAGYTDELQPSFATVGGDDAKDVKTSPRNVGEYGEVVHELIVGGVDPTDVDQGSIGDCWWMASMGAVAQADPGLIEDAITVNDNGTYTVHLYDDGERVAVTVTPEMVLVDGSPALAQSPLYLLSDDGTLGYELWPLVLEKALALQYGDYQAIEGGWPADGMTALTGRESTTHDVDDLSLRELASTLADGGAVGLGSHTPDDAKKSPYYQESAGGQLLQANHAYYLQSVDVEGGTVTFVNPWGIISNPPITMDYTDYVDQFRRVDVNEVS